MFCETFHRDDDDDDETYWNATNDDGRGVCRDGASVYHLLH
jgi:hypothetical protein